MTNDKLLAALGALRGQVAQMTPGLWAIGRFESYGGAACAPFRCVYRDDRETANTRVYVWGADPEERKDEPTYDCDADAAGIATLRNVADELIAAAEALITARSYGWDDERASQVDCDAALDRLAKKLEAR